MGDDADDGAAGGSEKTPRPPSMPAAALPQPPPLQRMLSDQRKLSRQHSEERLTAEAEKMAALKAAAAEKERPAIVTATAWNANARADGRVAVAIGRAGRWTGPRCRQRHFPNKMRHNLPRGLELAAFGKSIQRPRKTLLSRH